MSIFNKWAKNVLNERNSCWTSSWHGVMLITRAKALNMLEIDFWIDESFIGYFWMHFMFKLDCFINLSNEDRMAWRNQSFGDQFVGMNL